MSRRVSRIQRTMQASVRMPPTIEKNHVSVTPTRISVIPTAVSSGRIGGPGRWISSPTGGASAGGRCS